METNMLRLTDKYDDPVAELRLAANALRVATRRVVERAIDNGPLRGLARVVMKPRIRISEDDETAVVVVEIAGIDTSSLEVTLSSKNVLCVKGRANKRTDAGAQSGSEHQPRERSFERTVPLDDRMIERERASARFDNGLLTVTIPKSVKAKSTDSAEHDVRAA